MHQYSDLNYSKSYHIMIMHFSLHDPIPSTFICHIGASLAKHHIPVVYILDLTLHQIFITCTLALWPNDILLLI